MLAFVVSALYALAVAFVPQEATPYFTRGPAAEAARNFRLEKWTEAADQMTAYARANPKVADIHQARFIAAYAAHKAGRFAEAVDGYQHLIKSYPLLAEYHRAGVARAELARGRFAEALAAAQQLDKDSALDGEARLIRADALRALGKKSEAADELRNYVLSYPDSWRVHEARFRMAELLSELGRTDEALVEWKRLYVEAPTERWGKEAEKRLPEGVAPTILAPELAKRADALASNMRNPESEAEWQRVLLAPGITDQLRCAARYNLAQSVFKQRNRQRAAPLFDEAAAACVIAKDDELTTKSLYQGGRSWGAKGDKDLEGTKHAVSLFERVWKEHPQHSYADDARVRAAEALDSIKDEARAAELLGSVASAHPDGDQRGEALWRLAFRAWKKGDLVSAEKWLRQELAAIPREEGWWEAGRTLYWLARLAAERGEAQPAIDLYRRAVREYPLSYYALASLHRIRERDAKTADALIVEVANDAGDASGWRFSPRAQFGDPAFARAVELVRLGLGPEAKRELARAGIVVPKKRNAKVNADDEELMWAAAVLFDQAGQYSISHFIPRYITTSHERAMPQGVNKKRWLLSYPRGYADLVIKHTAANALPTALEFAIIREESAFDPLMESFANAVGLTQLTAAPAERFALGLPHDRQALRDPTINVTIGARELGHLYKMYGQNAALAIASYNAGEGAVNRWLKDPEKNRGALDELIESIPYDETRGYTKRVLASYFAYAWLYGQTPSERVPPLPLGIAKK